MERRLRPGIAQDDFDRSNRSPLRTTSQGRQDVSASRETWRPLAGATQNNRGAGRIVHLDADVGQDILAVPSIAQTPQAIADDAEVISIYLALDVPAAMQDPASNATLIPLNITAIIEWGIGGAAFSAECDWTVGTTFAVTANFVKVSARVAALPALGPIGDVVQDVVLSVGFGYGNALSTNTSSPVRRTLFVGDAAALAVIPVVGGLIALETSTVMLVPAWAVGFTLVDGGQPVAGGGILPPSYLISMGPTMNGFTTTYLVTSRNNEARQVEGQFPVPIDGRFITVKNLLATPTTGTKLIFNLAF